MEPKSAKAFFSYARVDSEFVLRLATELRSAGACLWLDQLDISAGDRWDSSVESALKSCSYMVVALSPASTASQNVLDEISFALEKNKKIIPIVYRTCDIPFRLKRLQYIDFSVDYRAAFTSLLVALNVTPPGTSLDIAEGIQKPIGNPPRELSSRKETRFSDDGPRGEPYTDLRTTTEKTTRIFTRERIIAASLGFL